MNTAIEIAKSISMLNARRHVYIRGYIREVTVLDMHPNKDNEYRCRLDNRVERVPSHLFYHQGVCGLVLRDSVEFKRKYSDHPIGCVNLPDFVA